MSKELIAKVANGETLTETERATLKAFNIDEMMNGAAAGARKEAEAKLAKADQERAELKARLDAIDEEIKAKELAKKPEIDRYKITIDDLTKKLSEKDASLASIVKEKAQLARDRKISELTAPIKFVEGIDDGIRSTIIGKIFDGVSDDQLGNETIIKPLLEKFQATNKAFISDPSKGGTGGKHNSNGNGGGSNGNHVGTFSRSEISNMSLEDYEKNRTAIGQQAAAGAIKDN